MNFKRFSIAVPLLIAAAVLIAESCITVLPPPPPMPDELKDVQLVYGWSVTRELEESCKSVRMESVSRSADWWSVHRRAKELKTNVAQLVYDCYYDCDVRFWACGEKFLPDSKKDAVKQFGTLAGKIKEINGNEITVTGKNISEQAPMGKILAVDAEGKMVYIEVTFPMMTLAKCKVVKGSIRDLKPGMNAYNKPATK